MKTEANATKNKGFENRGIGMVPTIIIMVNRLKMYDMACGLKGASRAMKSRGWEVITLDNDPKFNPDIIADLRTWNPPEDDHPLLLWFSPPCDEFARESMPWSKTGQSPDLSIVEGCIRIKDIMKPTFWILENVRGAVPWVKPLLGDPAINYGAFYLWGFFPIVPREGVSYRKKESYSSKQKEQRAEIPITLSTKLAQAMECAVPLL